MCKTCWTISMILLLTVLGISYKFIYSGAVTPSTDGREAILLSDSERNLVLGEMRQFLESVQKITHGLTINDMKIVSEAAKKVGTQAQQAVPASLMGKLPLSFKKMGFDTHSKFNTLALDAEQLGDQQHALQQLSTLMNNCVACHSVYKLELEKIR